MPVVARLMVMAGLDQWMSGLVVKPNMNRLMGRRVEVMQVK